jgi:hypothetical protein
MTQYQVRIKTGENGAYIVGNHDYVEGSSPVGFWGSNSKCIVDTVSGDILGRHTKVEIDKIFVRRLCGLTYGREISDEKLIEFALDLETEIKKEGLDIAVSYDAS